MDDTPNSPDAPTIIYAAMLVTCNAEGCENSGIEIEAMVNSAAPAVICGPCGEWIIEPTSDEAPEN